MRIKSKIKAGGLRINHNEKRINARARCGSETAGLKMKSSVKAGTYGKIEWTY